MLKLTVNIGATLVGAMIGWIVAANPAEDGASSSANGATMDQADEPTEADAQIESFVRYAMPGEPHRLLDKLAGCWRMAIKYRMNADSPVVESVGTCDRKWILGKRFVLEEFDGGNLGLPFQGLAVYGYDAFEKAYSSVWVDTTNTAMTTSAGICRDDCHVIEFTGRHGDPWSGKKKPSHGFTRFVSDDRHVLELYEPSGEGEDFKVLEIVYTRAPAE